MRESICRPAQRFVRPGDDQLVDIRKPVVDCKTFPCIGHGHPETENLRVGAQRDGGMHCADDDQMCWPGKHVDEGIDLGVRGRAGRLAARRSNSAFDGCPVQLEVAKRASRSPVPGAFCPAAPLGQSSPRRGELVFDGRANLVKEFWHGESFVAGFGQASGSTKTSIVPPQASPTSQASSSLTP